MESLGVPLLLIMMIWVGLKLPIAEPLTAALLKGTGLKWAKGRMPPLVVQQGASAMTSAEEFAAPLSEAVTVWLQPCVLLGSFSVYVLRLTLTGAGEMVTGPHRVAE